MEKQSSQGTSPILKYGVQVFFVRIKSHFDHTSLITVVSSWCIVFELCGPFLIQILDDKFYASVSSHLALIT